LGAVGTTLLRPAPEPLAAVAALPEPVAAPAIEPAVAGLLPPGEEFWRGISKGFWDVGITLW